jgi:hypothetical protein
MSRAGNQFILFESDRKSIPDQYTRYRSQENNRTNNSEVSAIQNYVQNRSLSQNRTAMVFNPRMLNQVTTQPSTNPDHPFVRPGTVYNIYSGNAIDEHSRIQRDSYSSVRDEGEEVASVHRTYYRDNSFEVRRNNSNSIGLANPRQIRQNIYTVPNMVPVLPIQTHIHNPVGSPISPASSMIKPGMFKYKDYPLTKEQRFITHTETQPIVRYPSLEHKIEGFRTHRDQQINGAINDSFISTGSRGDFVQIQPSTGMQPNQASNRLPSRGSIRSNASHNIVSEQVQRIIPSHRDLNDDLERLPPYEELVLPPGDIFVDDLFLSKPVYISGTNQTTLHIRNRIVCHLEPNYEGMSVRQRRLENIFAPHSSNKFQIDYNMPKNKVLLFGFRIIFVGEGNVSLNGATTLFELSPCTSIGLSGCAIISPTPCLRPQNVFTCVDYFGASPNPPVQGLIEIDSCSFHSFFSLYTCSQVAQKLLINRSQFIEFKGTVLTCSKDSNVAIDNSTFNGCLGRVLEIVPSAPENAALSQQSRGMNPGNFLMNIFPTRSNQMKNKFAEGKMHNNHFESDDPNAIPKSFIGFKNVNFIRTQGWCTLVNEDVIESRQREYISFKDCLFDQNMHGCSQSIRNRKVSLGFYNCRFLKTGGVCLSTDGSLSMKVVSCKFEDNHSNIIIIKDNSIQFTKNVCYRNKKGILVTANKGVLMHMINIVQNRLDKIDENGIEVLPADTLRVNIHINIIMCCRNAVVIDSRNTPTTSLKPIFEFWDNDILNNQEFGYVMLGSNFTANLRHDTIKNNGAGAVLYDSGSADTSSLKMDQEIPPIIQGDVVINGLRRPTASNERCALI